MLRNAFLSTVVLASLACTALYAQAPAGDSLAATRALAPRAPQTVTADPSTESPRKYQGTALAWSLAGTLAPILLAGAVEASSGKGDGGLSLSLYAGGLLLGPSLGQFYAASPARGLLSAGIRTAGGLLTFYGFGEALGKDRCREDNDEGSARDCGGYHGEIYMAAGLATYFAGVVYSLYDDGQAVERFNAKHGDKEVFGWAPTLAPGLDGSLRPGALAWMRF